jgi:Carboxypeptidase regulatory-like domain/TonB dependent receptor
MRRSLKLVSTGCLLSVLACASLWGQATAQVSGTAKDQSGAVLPGVEISVTQIETGITRNAITNESGSYVLANLPTGPYRLEAALPGFRTFAQTGIVLQVNSSPVINVVLDVGQVSETVEVQANAAFVETRSSTLGSVIENERIMELPLNGRNVTDLITLAGGAVLQNSTSQNFVAGAPLLAIAGGAAWGVDYMLDGSSHVSFLSGSTMILPFPDAMQEFKVESSGTGAQRGNSTGVAAVTKSGTNEIHGDLFEFVRNDLFNARNYFANGPSTLKRNQFGGTIGGPIAKNKLFFFGGYQGTTLRQDPADNQAFIPTAAMLAGDWTAFTSPACNAGRQVTLRAPFVNNRIDPTLYSKPALFIVNWKGYLPFPKTDSPCGDYVFGNAYNSNISNLNLGNYVGKVDYQESAKHSLFGRVLIGPDHKPNPENLNTELLQSTGWRSSLSSSYTLGSTYVVSAHTVQSFRLAVNRTAVHFRNVPAGKLFNWCDAGMNIYCEPIVTRINNFDITGGFNLEGGTVPPHSYVSTNYSMNDDVNIVHGTHQMTFGFNAVHGRVYAMSTDAAVTSTSFSGAVTGLGLADFMLGQVSSITLARTNPHRVNGTTFGLYGTDSWKATQRLTLNYGLRWDPYIPQNALAIFNFDHDRFLKGIKSSTFPSAPAGLYFRGDPGFPENGVNAQWLHFAPRLGLAWDVNGNGRTSIRTSYAYSYVYVPGDFRLTYSGGSPWGGRAIISSPPGGIEDPWRGIPGGNIFPYAIDKNAPFPPYGAFYTQDANMRAPRSQSWNLSVQRQIGTNWIVTSTYIGSNVMHAWANKSINPAIYIPGGPCTLNGVTYNPCSSVNNTDARRILSLERPADGQKYGFVAEGDDGASQFYHGMLLSVERRAVRGVTVNTNYTWSHCVGDDANLYNPMGNHPNNTYTNATDRRADRGNCVSDRRHIFNLTAVAETPQFSNRTVRVLATGWRLSGIYRKSAGSLLNITAGTDRALNGIGSQRAIQVLQNPFGDKSAGPRARYLNPAAFAIPALGTVGNVGRNSIQGPGTWAFDVALSRVFRVRENQRLEFRAESYNVTNTFRPGNPSSGVNSNTFGVIRTALDPRLMQFALKYVF